MSFKWAINDTREDVVVPAFGSPHTQIAAFRKTLQNVVTPAVPKPPKIRKTKSNGKQSYREMISARTEHTCFYCGTAEGFWTIEHLVPRAHGGGNDFWNLVRACAPCNHRRGSGLAIRHHMKITPRFEQNLALAERALKKLDEISLRKWGVPAHHYCKVTLVNFHA